jgi:cell division protease FtsH
MNARRPPPSDDAERAPGEGRQDRRPSEPGWRVTPAPDGRGAPEGGDQRAGPPRRWWPLLVLVVMLAINFGLSRAALGPAERTRIPYRPTFLEQLRSGNVRSISSADSSVQGELKRAIRYPADDKKAERSTRFATHVPEFADHRELDDLLAQHDVIVDARAPDTGAPWWETVIVGLLPTLLIFGLLFVLFRRLSQRAGGLGGIGGLGRAKAGRSDPGTVQVSFDDVAGIDEVKDELAEIVDFLRNPERYQRLGARMPHGVLLTGPPGTGKTLLARAMAGEAGVPFFTMSASEFIEMVVGVGASRVRDLFRQAKEAAPAIVFIDELDAIGRRRGGNVFSGGGGDEREQTLNQILTEMDGFDPRTGVAVLAATNRPDVLDPALLRPGRFDRRVHVAPPDKDGRRAILRVHTRSLPLATDVDLDALAATTPGMTGADLANLANEAALTATRRRHEQIHMRDFTDALERIVLGAERKILMTSDDRRRTAYHEAGHAIAGMFTAGADPVRKVSIIPRGQALGVTFSAPERDRLSYDEQDLLARIRVALGGRVAEELVFGTHTTGAESDLQQVTDIARRMVARWGMSDAIGPMVTQAADADGPLLPGATAASPDTQRLVDEEVRRILTAAHSDVTELLTRRREQLDALAYALLEHETLDGPAAYRAAGVRPPGALDPTPPPAADVDPSPSATRRER